MTCQKCGKDTREVVPVLLPAALVSFHPRHYLPRSALSPEANAAIPWGKHPRDGGYAQYCRGCAGA